MVLAANDELPEPFARGWTLLVTVLGVVPTGVGTANAKGRLQRKDSAKVCMLRVIYTETTGNHKICTEMVQPRQCVEYENKPKTYGKEKKENFYLKYIVSYG